MASVFSSARKALSAFRVVFAALFVFIAPLSVIGWISNGSSDLPVWGIVVVLLAFLFAIYLALFLFNRRGFRPALFGLNTSESRAALERDGILVRESFTAIRAFEVEEYEDEGLHYFLELATGDVLYLSGQFLYGYDMFEGDEEEEDLPRSRQFPCTEFELLRHCKVGNVVDLVCKGEALEPELVLPHRDMPKWRRGDWLDFDVIRSVSYDRLKPSSKLRSTGFVSTDT